MSADLIYDIGANNGDDSGFYLAKGFRVVAVEADPTLVEKLQERFAAERAAGQFVVENIGVSDSDDMLDFFVNDFSEWSSFVKNGKATRELGHRKIQVKTEPLSRIIERHGAARYLKIDIEGFERQALSTLTKDMPLPDYLSFEVNKDWQANLVMLTDLGYTEYHIVRQGKGFVPNPPQPAQEGADVPQEFTNSQSGCFGRDLTGTWHPASEIKRAMILETQAAEARLARGERRGWHDIHCKLG